MGFINVSQGLQIFLGKQKVNGIESIHGCVSEGVLNILGNLIPSNGTKSSGTCGCSELAITQTDRERQSTSETLNPGKS